jgi:hypothetical protein
MAAVAKILLTSSKLSASGGLWKRSEAQLLTATAFGSSGYWLSMGTTAKTINVTFATNSNQQGILLNVRSAASGSLTIKLYEGANLRTTDTFNLTTNPITIGSGANGWHYFPLTSYAVTTAAATWSYQLATGASTSPSVLVTTSGGTDINYAVICDADTTVPASGDTTIIADNITLSVDQAVTHGPMTDSTMAVIPCLGSTYQCLNADLTAPITIAINAYVWPVMTSKFLIGTSADPISLAHKVTLDYSASSQVYVFTGTTSNSYTIATATSAFEFYGVEDPYIGARVAADAAANQKDVVLTTDLSAQWTNGDALCLIGKARTDAGDFTNNTIGSMSGTTLTLGTNLDYKLLKGAAIVNGNRSSKCGIEIKGSAAQALFTLGTRIDYIQMAGVYLNKVSLSGTTGLFLLNNTKYAILRNILWADGGDTISHAFFITIANNMVASGIYEYTTMATYRNSTFFMVTGNNMTITNVFSKGHYIASTLTPTMAAYAAVISIMGNGNVISGLVSASGRVSATDYLQILIIGASCTVSDIFDYTPLNYAVILSLIGSTLNNLIVNGAKKYNIVLYNCINLTFGSPFIGVETAGTIGEIWNTSDGLNQVVLSSPTFNVSPVLISDNITNALPGSYIRIQNYNTTANDCRGYETYGKYVSTKAGFTDSTVHTAGGLAMRREPTSSTNQDTWVQTFPTGNIQNKSMTVIVWCNINSANYYGGAVYQLPRLTINYDNGTIAYVQASASIGWQRLAVTFTPLTTYGQVTATLSTMTNATGSNAYVYWDDYDFQLPSGVQLNLGLMDDWANGLPIMPSIATNITAKSVADAVWDDLKADHVVASSFGKHVQGLNNPSLIIDGEIIV